MKMWSSQDSHSQYNENLCHLIHVVNDVIVEEVSDLSCDHEEADTRLLPNILIKQYRTDTGILFIAFAKELTNFFIFVCEQEALLELST